MKMHDAGRDPARMDGGEVVERGTLIREDADQRRGRGAASGVLRNDDPALLRDAGGNGCPGGVLYQVEADALAGAARQADRLLVDGEAADAGLGIQRFLDLEHAIDPGAGISGVDRHRHPGARLDHVLVAGVHGQRYWVVRRVTRDGGDWKGKRGQHGCEANTRGQTQSPETHLAQ